MVEYSGDDPRLPEPVRAFNRERIAFVAVAPLVLATRTLGWVALSNGKTSMCEGEWRVALLEAIARQATLALHQSRQADRSRLEERRKAILEERNRLARDIHDTLAQGFAAILMQLQAAQRESAEPCRRRSREARDRRRPRAQPHDRGAALGLRAPADHGRGRGSRRGVQAHDRHGAPHVRGADRARARRPATLRRCHRARDRGRRAGSADQRGAAREGAADHRARRIGAIDRLPPVGGRRRPRHRPRAAARRLRHDEHAGARESDRRVAYRCHRAATRHGSGSGLAAVERAVAEGYVVA